MSTKVLRTKMRPAMVVYGASYNYSDTTTTTSTTLVLATSTATSDTTTNTSTNTTTSLQQIPAYNCTSTSNSTSNTTTDTFISCTIHLYYYKYCVAATFNAIVYDYSNHDNVVAINQKNLVIMKNNMSAVPMSKILSNTSTNQTNEKTALMMSTQNITTILNLMHHRTREHLQILLQRPIRDVMCTKMPPTVVCLLITEIAITLLMMRLLKESPSQAC